MGDHPVPPSVYTHTGPSETTAGRRETARWRYPQSDMSARWRGFLVQRLEAECTLGHTNRAAHLRLSSVQRSYG